MAGHSTFEVDEPCRRAKSRMANDCFAKLEPKCQRLQNVHPEVGKKKKCYSRVCWSWRINKRDPSRQKDIKLSSAILAYL